MTVVAFWVMASLAIVGAATVLLARETVRLVTGLGTFLLGVAGLYLFYAMPLLAGAQVFLYVGGVLVLFLFAIMALRSDGGGRTALTVRFELLPAVVCVGLYVVLVAALSDLSSATAQAPAHTASVEAVGSLLLGGYMPAFELVGGLLLVALVAVLAISGRGDRP